MVYAAYEAQSVGRTTTNALTFGLKCGKIALTELNGYC